MEEVFRWSELLEYLKENHREVRTFPKDRVRFTYVLDGTEVPVGAHVIRTTRGTPWMVFNMKIVAVGQLRTRSALVANSDLPIGGLCILPEHAVIRQSLPLTGMRVVDLEHVVRSLARLRAQLQEVAAMPDADLDTPYSYVFR